MTRLARFALALLDAACECWRMLTVKESDLQKVSEKWGLW